MRILQLVKDKQWRAHNIRYWLSDPFWGGLDYLCHYAFRLMPLDWPGKIGAVLGPLAAAVRYKAANQRADTNLKVLKPGLSDPERKALLHQMWQNVGQTISEYSIADLLWRDGRVEIKNPDYVLQCRAQGVPMVFVTVHLANWEVVGGVCKDNNIPLLSSYQPERNRFVAQLAQNSRRQLGLKTIPAETNALRVMYKHLRDGGALWFALDEYKNQQVVWPPLGRDIDTRNSNAANVIQLAKRFNAAIIPYKTERKKNSRFIVTVCPPLMVSDNPADTLGQLNRLVESWLLEHPEDWYMLHQLRF